MCVNPTLCIVFRDVHSLGVLPSLLSLKGFASFHRESTSCVVILNHANPTPTSLGIGLDFPGLPCRNGARHIAQHSRELAVPQGKRQASRAYAWKFDAFSWQSSNTESHSSGIKARGSLRLGRLRHYESEERKSASRGKGSREGNKFRNNHSLVFSLLAIHSLRDCSTRLFPSLSLIILPSSCWLLTSELLSLFGACNEKVSWKVSFERRNVTCFSQLLIKYKLPAITAPTPPSLLALYVQ